MSLLELQPINIYFKFVDTIFTTSVFKFILVSCDFKVSDSHNIHFYYAFFIVMIDRIQIK